MPNDNTNSNGNIIFGPLVQLDENYGGLGVRYLDKLFTNIDKIHQIDTVTGITESNGSVRSRAISLAQVLRRKGVVPNDIILICSRCHADQTVVVLAALLVAAIVAPLDPELSRSDTIVILKNIKPKFCFCDVRAFKNIEHIMCELEIDAQMIHFGDEQPGMTTFRKLLISGGPKSIDDFTPIYIEHPRKCVAFILQTQATTGVPKLVCLSHHFIYAQTRIMLDIWNNPDKVLSFFSLSWIMQAVLVCLCFEAPIVRVLTGVFAERSACKVIYELKVDCAFLGTQYAIKLVDSVAVKDFNLSCLKTVAVGSLSTTTSDLEHISRLLPNINLVQMYFTTETGCVLSYYPSDYDEIRDRIETVGKVLQNYAVKLVDIKSKLPVGANKYGELYVTGNLMLGYFKDLAATKSAMEDKFYKTGDVATHDESDWFYIRDRIEDLIPINGGNDFLFPRELEDTILRHPFVKDVCVVGDVRQIVACVITKPQTTLDSGKLMK